MHNQEAQLNKRATGAAFYWFSLYELEG